MSGCDHLMWQDPRFWLKKSCSHLKTWLAVYAVHVCPFIRCNVSLLFCREVDKGFHCDRDNVPQERGENTIRRTIMLSGFPLQVQCVSYFLSPEFAISYKIVSVGFEKWKDLFAHLFLSIFKSSSLWQRTSIYFKYSEKLTFTYSLHTSKDLKRKCGNYEIKKVKLKNIHISVSICIICPYRVMFGTGLTLLMLR